MSDKERKEIVEYLCSIHRDDLEIMLNWIFKNKEGYKDVLEEIK
jgi:hypothetical protein